VASMDPHSDPHKQIEAREGQQQQQIAADRTPNTSRPKQQRPAAHRPQQASNQSGRILAIKISQAAAGVPSAAASQRAGVLFAHTRVTANQRGDQG